MATVKSENFHKNFLISQLQPMVWPSFLSFPQNNSNEWSLEFGFLSFVLASNLQNLQSFAISFVGEIMKQLVFITFIYV